MSIECQGVPPCFGRRGVMCKVLTVGTCIYYKASMEGQGCPFCKPSREVTEGREYPFNDKEKK